jgi:hypothetical protein
MRLVDEVLKYRSVSITGTAKNTGKTECLNYILRNIPSEVTVATTSIGVDGEGIDAVTNTSKPEVYLKKGTYFATSETHYRERRITSEIIGLSASSSSLGRYVTGKTISDGKLKLSGPSSIADLGAWMQKAKLFPIDLFLIDGAASRLSSATPFVTDAFILCTGAAACSRIETLIQQTEYLVSLSSLCEANEEELQRSQRISAFTEEKDIFPLSKHCYNVTGALTDKLVNMFLRQKMGGITLIVKDFTKVFVARDVYRRFIEKGGRIAVEKSAKLIAICINPTSPYGLNMESGDLRTKLASRVNVPVFDLFVSDEV